MLCKLQKRWTRLAAASDKVYQLLAHCRWFSPGTPASSTTKPGRHDIAEILLKVVLNNWAHKTQDEDKQNTNKENQKRWASQAQSKSGSEPRCSWRVSSPWLLLDNRHVSHLFKTDWTPLCANKCNKNSTLFGIRPILCITRETDINWPTFYLIEMYFRNPCNSARVSKRF
jgi:hypothetical protein